MNNQETRTREHLANERTFLAWIRTSIAIMAFGFVVERFSLFMHEIAALFKQSHLHSTSSATQNTSSLFGIALVAFGVLICLLSFLKYTIVTQQIEIADYQPSKRLNLLLTLFIVGIGLLLVIYLGIGI